MSEGFATWLQQKIEERGLSLRAASLYSGLGVTTLQRLVNESDRTPSPQTCMKLAKYFNTDPDIVLAMAGHRELQTPPERREFSPEVLEMLDAYYDLPEELQPAALRLMQRVIDTLESELGVTPEG